MVEHNLEENEEGEAKGFLEYRRIPFWLPKDKRKDG